MCGLSFHTNFSQVEVFVFAILLAYCPAPFASLDNNILERDEVSEVIPAVLMAKTGAKHTDTGMHADMSGLHSTGDLSVLTHKYAGQHVYLYGHKLQQSATK